VCNSRSAFRGSWLAGALLAVTPPAHGISPPDGLRLAAEGRCAEALPLLGNDPSDPIAQRARALCLLQEADYAAAAQELARIESSDPSVATDLGIARFHVGDLAGAEAALQGAQARGDERPEVPLYLALIALERAQASEASARLEGARIDLNDPFAPAAAFYAGVARARAADGAAAREDFERIARDWPDSAWATEARRAADALSAPSAGFASVRLGFEHDSNVVLRGQGVVLPEEMPGQADQRLFWRAAGGRTWQPAGNTEVGGALVFSGWLHGELTDFDVLNPSLTLWVDRRLGERALLRGVAGYAHAWVGGDDFLSEPSFALELHRAWDERGATRVFVELAPDDYRFASLETDPTLRRARDRDGLGVRAGVEHRFPLQTLGSALTASLAYRGFSADGSEYSFDSPELAIGWESSLPARFELGAGVWYAYRSYRHPTTYPPEGSDREEHDWSTELSLRRPVWREISLETRWRYQRNRSSVDVFDYTRHVVGLYASWSLNP
jgi:tetratricopeptide (TPR) repeat protein